MDDLISRQAAIDAIPNRKKGLGGESWMMTYRRSGYNDCRDECLDAIRQLPSAQPERKKGKWMDMGDYCVCNQCWHTEQQFNGVERIPRHTPFCAMCGADMREEKNDVGSKV